MGRIAKWAIMLLPFNITYKPQRAIKSQVLADFVAEWTEAELPKEYGTYSNWIMHFDGSKMLAGLGAGIVLTSPTGDMVQYVLQILYTDPNNAAEYEALLHGLRMAVSMGIQRLEVRGDSNLAISQINGDFDANDPKMAACRNAIVKMSARIKGLESTMWLEKITKRRISSPASRQTRPCPTQHIPRKAVQAIRGMGRRVRPY